MEQMKARDYGLMKISLMEADYLAKMASCNMDAEINLMLLMEMCLIVLVLKILIVLLSLCTNGL